MYNFILQTVVMVSFGSLIYMVARAVPRVTDTEVTGRKGSDYLDTLMKKLPLEKADAMISSWLEKFLRKGKVLILKLDNLLNKHLQNLKPSQGNPTETKLNLFEKKDDSN